MTPSPHQIVILAYDGLCLFEYALALEVLSERVTPSGAACYEVRTASIDGAAVTADRGPTLTVEGDRSLLRDADTIVVPGWRTGPVPQDLCDALIDAHRRGARIVSICTGAFVLAAAGLLDGRRATTHWNHARQLAALHPAVEVDPHVLYIDDGDVLTSAGSSAGVDLLLHLIRRDFGTAVCNDVARRMVVPPHRDGGQSQFAAAPVPAIPSSSFSRVMEHLRADPAADHRIDDLARMAAMSPRTFFRRFRATTGHAPYDWLLMERLRLARTMLEESRLGVDEIALRAGFGSADTFRHHFRRIVGATPTRYRAGFRPLAASAGTLAGRPLIEPRLTA